MKCTYCGLETDSKANHHSESNCITALNYELAALRAAAGELLKLRPASEWHDDVGDVLWWVLPVEEPPYVGSPLSSGWPFEDFDTGETVPGVFWSRIPVPGEAECAAALAAGK